MPLFTRIPEKGLLSNRAPRNSRAKRPSAKWLSLELGGARAERDKSKGDLYRRPPIDDNAHAVRFYEVFRYSSGSSAFGHSSSYAEMMPNPRGQNPNKPEIES